MVMAKCSGLAWPRPCVCLFVCVWGVCVNGDEGNAMQCGVVCDVMWMWWMYIYQPKPLPVPLYLPLYSLARSPSTSRLTLASRSLAAP